MEDLAHTYTYKDDRVQDGYPGSWCLALDSQSRGGPPRRCGSPDVLAPRGNICTTSLITMLGNSDFSVLSSAVRS